ncbi:MAG: type II secretion system protein J [Bacillota bacterium]
MRKLNNKGFSLTELLVGIGMLAAVALCVASFFVMANKSTKTLEEDLSISTDVLLLERMLVHDFKASSSSFNNISMRDDRGFNFFDYITDMQDQTDRGSRTVTLWPDKNEFIFIVDALEAASMLYAPEKAYNVGPQPSASNAAAPLTFVSLNKDDIVTKKTKDSGDLWQSGNTIMLDSPASFRRVTATGLDYTTPARSPIYLGILRKGTTDPGLKLQKIQIPVINYTNPLYPNEVVTDEDYFLRNIPAVGGGNPLVRLKKVYVVKYYLKTRRDKKVSVYRSVYDGEKFPEGNLLATGVISLTFMRSSATSSIIDYKIEKVEKE